MREDGKREGKYKVVRRTRLREGDREERTEVDGVDLPFDLNDGALASVDVDDLVDLDVLENDVGVVLLVLLPKRINQNEERGVSEGKKETTTRLVSRRRGKETETHNLPSVPNELHPSRLLPSERRRLGRSSRSLRRRG